jgi:hypothetical protein
VRKTAFVLYRGADAVTTTIGRIVIVDETAKTIVVEDEDGSTHRLHRWPTIYPTFESAQAALLELTKSRLAKLKEDAEVTEARLKTIPGMTAEKASRPGYWRL